MEHTEPVLKKTPAHWGQAFEQDHYDEVMRVAQGAPEEIQEYLAERGETLLSNEIEFLEATIALKKNQAASKEEAPLLESEFETETPEQKLLRIQRGLEEGRALLKLEERGGAKWFKTIFSKTPTFTEVGKVYTREGRELLVVQNEKGEKFARYDIYKGAIGANYHGLVKTVYLPYEKVQPFLRK